MPFRVQRSRLWVLALSWPEQCFAFVWFHSWRHSRCANRLFSWTGLPWDRHFSAPPAPIPGPFRLGLVWSRTLVPISVWTKHCSEKTCLHLTFDIHWLTPKSLSNTFLSFFLFWIPFSFAKRSHLVSGLATGHLRVRGNTNAGGGNFATTHSSTRSVGSSQTSFTNSCTLSRINAHRYSFLFLLRRYIIRVF